jgi:hypothetical protein
MNRKIKTPSQTSSGGSALLIRGIGMGRNPDTTKCKSDVKSYSTTKNYCKET